jgi:hypothetical protein
VHHVGFTVLSEDTVSGLITEEAEVKRKVFLIVDRFRRSYLASVAFPQAKRECRVDDWVVRKNGFDVISDGFSGNTVR